MDRKEAAGEILSALARIRSKKPAVDVQNGSRGEAMVLHLVAVQPAGITPGRLREQMDVSSARIAAILGALEAKGMLERRVDENDRRRIQVILTPKGSQRASRDAACLLAHVERCLDALEDEEIACCIRVLEKLEKLRDREEKLC